MPYITSSSDSRSSKAHLHRGIRAFVWLVVASSRLEVVETHEVGHGVIGFLRTAEDIVERRSFWFYRHFGQKRKEGRLQKSGACDFSDPNTIKYCPPTNSLRQGNDGINDNPNFSFVGAFLPPAERKAALQKLGLEEAQDETFDLDEDGKNKIRFIPIKCLENPDGEGCEHWRELQVGGAADVGLPSMNDGSDPIQQGASSQRGSRPPVSAPSKAVRDYPEGSVSQSPTTDMCFGNMALPGPRRHVWCQSEMPSVSLEPSISTRPTVVTMPSFEEKPIVASKPSISTKTSSGPSLGAFCTDNGLYVTYDLKQPSFQFSVNVTKSLNSSIHYTLSQTYKDTGDEISWMLPVSLYDKVPCQQKEQKKNVPTNATIYPFRAACVENRASISLYVHDDVFNTSSIPRPEECSDRISWPTEGKGVALYTISIPCDGSNVCVPTPSPSRIPTERPTTTPSPPPTPPPLCPVGTDNLGPQLSASDFQGEFGTLAATNNISAPLGRESQLSLLIGGNYNGPLAAEIEGNIVVLGDFKIGNRGVNSLGTCRATFCCEGSAFLPLPLFF